MPWPTREWPRGDPPAGADLEGLLDEAFDDSGPLAQTLAVVVAHGGRVVAERYGGLLEHFDRPPEPVGPDTPLLSWSMAKSMLHAAVGILVGEGRLELHGPAPVPEWSDPHDPRHAITIEDMLEMRDGLDWSEDYVDAGASDVIEMLFGQGQHDMAAFAASRPARWRAGEHFAYSSGTTNILAGILRRTVGEAEALGSWLDERIFGPIGARSVRHTFDTAGTWVGSSFVHATARDFARFGELYLRDGTWEGRRILPEGWVDHGRRPRSVDEEDGHLYGAHWWVVGDEWGSFRAAGYEGQTITITPALDLVLVRLGKTPEARADLLEGWRNRVVREVASALGA
ncbi:MAG TPA: serine hydrolase [Acidimicrobiales bacterium]|nr:serine hydrolase [Acidimicrobiales bacterium]